MGKRNSLKWVCCMMLVLIAGSWCTARADGTFKFDFTPESIEIDERHMTVGLQMDAANVFTKWEPDAFVNNDEKRVEMMAGIMLCVTDYSEKYGTAKIKDAFYDTLLDRFMASLISDDMKVYVYKTGKGRVTAYIFFDDCFYVLDVHMIARAITAVRAELKDAMKKADTLTKQWAAQFNEEIYIVNNRAIWLKYRKLMSK